MTKILMIDDDMRATRLLEKILAVEGYETVSVNNSSKAVQIAKLINPDLFLLDLMMPDPDGFKLCRMLRTDSYFTNTPIMIVTALDDSNSRIDVFGAGANDYMTKPFNIDELVYRIRALTD